MWFDQRSRLNNGVDTRVNWWQRLLPLLWIFILINGEELFQFTRPVYNTTIQENPVGKVYVTPTEKMGIFISDSLLRVQYVIVDGNKDHFFVAESQKVGDFWFLRIRTSTRIQVALNRESREFYILHVKAVVNSNVLENVNFNAQTEVNIKILDANDLTPLFYPSIYTVSIPENTPLHQSVARVSAVDPDIGINGEIYYSFQNQTFQFAIHPTTGIVTLTRPLNIEKQTHYDLTVLAQDRGPKPKLGAIVKKSSSSLRIVVSAVNQHPPVIHSVTLPAILRNDLLHVYAIVRVVDKDRGLYGQVRSVDIVDGDPFEYFQISKGEHPDEYSITISENLQHASVTSQFNLTIKATDKGIPPKSSLKTVPVRIPHYDDRPLVFDSPKYLTSVEEIAPLNTPIVLVKASHPDGNKDIKIWYKIEDGNPFDTFTINPLTGLITTAKPLDWEKTPRYLLLASAQEQNINGLKRKGTTMVYIKVLDNNDNNPIFNSTSFITVHFEENKPIGSVVYTAHASDPDDGDNGYVSYHLANINYVPFIVDHFTGQIKIKEVLDFETMRTEYLLKVWASDWGTPFRRQSEISIRVLVTDVNDHRPQFEKVDCVGFVSKAAPVPTEILTLSALDFDADSSVTYKMISSEQELCFEVNTITGILTLTCDLSQRQFTECVINVSATDGQHYADVVAVTIKVVDLQQRSRLNNKNVVVECRDNGITKKLKEQIAVAKRNNQEGLDDVTEATPSRYGENLHSPQFCSGLPMEITAKENLLAGTELLRISAEDHDHGYNGKLVYVISNGNEDSCFEVEMHSGKLLIINELDRERTARYVLNISVFDLGQPPQSASTILEVIVEDANDNVPTFDRFAYDFIIPENAPNGMTIAKLVASDADSGPNGHLIFSLVTDTQDFYIDKITGMLSVHGPLDRERTEYYQLKVQVSDSGSEVVFSCDTLVSIQVQDVNDNSPHFPIEHYLVRLREDIPVGSVIMSLSATDPDLNEAGTVLYELLNDMMGVFIIDKEIGIIRLNRQLNYEERQIYNLTVVASDLGIPMRSSSAYLLVEIEEINVNNRAPVFQDHVATGSVIENQEEGTFVMQIKATDDKHENIDDKVTYFLETEEGTGLFRIDQKGRIWTRTSLDREEQSRYWLSVYAQDKDVVSLDTRLDVYIEVLDENDNIPLTEEPVYYPSVVEHSEPGTKVVRLIAFDEDQDSQDGITFNITAGNAQGLFVIEPIT
ncbi:fat-like cadherin-related tumor suppressor homolog, partial [Limulus polyphemus]|uniref:Fat-like cadherin-related tumor suppressor homolog n=1 Tax=Limulus polyphemus TaxID=6850 RepID=A0ABM1S153_LIMPO